MKEKAKRQKEVIYPLLQECSEIQDDDFWKSLFCDLSRGKCPKGILIYNGLISSTSKRNGFTYNINDKTDALEVSEELINLLKTNACIYSSNDINSKETSIQDFKTEYEALKNTDSWKKIPTRKMKENLILNYVFKIKKQYKLKNKNTKELYDNIKGALFDYGSHKSDDVIMKGGEIHKILDFEYDEEFKNVYNVRVEKYEEKVKDEVKKDILGSKWEKYITNVIRSVIKEEI
jgi:hypothetical protein